MGATGPHHAALINDDGSWKYTNSLVHETSPYLLQHAHNPVDWMPWGPEAFERAVAMDRPIFLSIGYSTCYWCHVMERQVFESPQLAELVNKRFVCIKVDREERPDVDDIYMTAVQAMTGRGGWPMSVFLTPPVASAAGEQNAGEGGPGLAPFWAGTYIPPEPAHGLPGFPQVVLGLDKAWREQRQDVLEQARRVAAAISDHLSIRDSGGEIGMASVTKAADQLMSLYESRHGGFGSAPKFPQPSNLTFLMAVEQVTPDAKRARALAYTLERMARGGMYDQVGGGFHRYSVDDHWLVPHFKKMLYDNGQLVEAYLMAHEQAPDPQDPELYSRVVRETCDYVIREMTDASGAFWSAQDAEVDAHEGANYLWDVEAVRAALADEAPEMTELALAMYGLERGPNFQDPHDPEAPAANVLFLPQRLDELAADRGMTLEALVEDRRKINKALLAVRDTRKQPGTDDKVLVAWNGMMIAGMARAGRVLSEPRYTQAAAAAADAILQHMRTSDGGLYRTMRGGSGRIAGFLEDYAFFTHGLLELYRATDEADYLDAALRLVEVAQAKFGAEHGGYFDTQADQPDLLVRVRTAQDGAIPSGNSQMVHNLLDLHELTGVVTHLHAALRDLRSSAGVLSRGGATVQHLQHALLRALGHDPTEGKAVEGAKLTTTPRRAALSVEVEPTVVDLSRGPAVVRVTLHVGEEYHINVSDPIDRELVATTLRLEQGKGVALRVHYPPGVKRDFGLGDGPIEIYEGTVVLEATVSAAAGQTPAGDPVLVLRYQPCTDRSCLAAKDVELPVKIQWEG